MNTLSTLFLHSSRAYSALADAIFGDSVSQSQFASSVSTRRMETAKAIIGTPRDIDVELTDDDMEILYAPPCWQTCLALDNLLLHTMAHDERTFLPLLNGVYTTAHRGLAYASPANIQPKHKLCLGCGAISEAWTCPVCGNEGNWLTGVEVPENEEEPTEDVTDFSLPNISLGDFPSERSVQPKRWEVFFFDGQEDDIFKATGLAKPQLV